MSTLDRNTILDRFYSYGSPRDQWLVGGEFERHLIKPDGQPLTYFEPRGIRWMIEQLGVRGWELEYEGDNPIAASKDGAFLTLEPGCQWELSGRPYRSLQAVADEAEAFEHLTDELLQAGETGARQVFRGYTPFADIEQIPWVPKGRYEQMREVLIQVGPLAHHMMKGTAATQVSFDFLDEEDAAEKMHLANAFAPLSTALTANSSMKMGKPNGYMSFRGHIWTLTDPARTGINFEAGFSFERWVDYLLHVPMMFIKQGDTYASGQGKTFAEWMASATPFGRPPTWKDWETHMTQVFPEVRIKRQIEIRGADCVPLPLSIGFAAMWQGLFYCDGNRSKALELAERFTAHGNRDERFAQACRHGLRGQVGDQSLLSWAEQLVELGRAGLEACHTTDAKLIEPLITQVARGESPARTWLGHSAQRSNPTIDFSAA